MDVHRSRFVNYPTSAINALAFSHQSTSDFSPHDIPNNLRLAVGRANGDVEIWNPTKGNWFQETVFLGGRNRSIEGLAWTQEPDETDEEGNVTVGRLRLFSIGYSSTVTEWNLETGVPLRHWNGNNGVIWCMAAQPKAVPEKGSTIQMSSQKIVAGCADGSLIILSTADDDLQFQKYLIRSVAKRARVLSLTFQNSNTLVAGFADGTIRVFDLESAAQQKIISLGAGPKGGPKDILVWAVKCLDNGNIVSGDSIGEIRIFEKKHFSQIQRITSHDADILSLAVQKKGSVIFSAGLDRRMAHYVPQRNKREQWLKGGHHTYHEHDVKTMAAYEGKGLNVIASGGLDTNLVIVPMRSHEKEYQLTFSGLPYHPPIVGASSTRLFASWWQQEVHIYQILEERSDEQYRQIARLCLKGEESIADIALSSDGSLLAVITPAELKLFKVLSTGENERNKYQIQRIETSSAESGKYVQISANSRWLAIVSHSNEVRLTQIQHTEDDKCNLDFKSVHRMEREGEPLLGSLSKYRGSINKICFSPGSKALAVSDLSGNIDCWNLQLATIPAPRMNGKAHQNGHLTNTDSSNSDSDSESEDESETVFGNEAWNLMPAVNQIPRLDSPALTLSFRTDPSIDQQESSEEKIPELFVLTAAHHLSAFDLSTGSYTEWSKRNPRDVLPEEFKQIRDRAKGMLWGPNGFLWIYGTNFLFGLDITVDHSPPPRPDLNTRKRKRGTHGAGGEIRETEKTGLIPESKEKISEVDEGGDKMDIDSDAEGGGEKLLDVYRGNELTNGVSKEGNEKKKWKMIHKFRTILGIVPIKKAEGRDNDILEVVVVERPIWDLDLPSRFESIHAR